LIVVRRGPCDGRGANTFKKDWVRLFKDRIVHLCHDKDDAGEKGAEKAAKALQAKE